MSAGFTRVYTIDIGGRAIVAFEASNGSEANSILKESWFLDDLRVLKSNGMPLWDEAAPLRARVANEDETNRYKGIAAEAKDLERGYCLGLPGFPRWSRYIGRAMTA